jgi:hypothetical protein
MASNPNDPNGGTMDIANNAIINGNGNINSFLLLLTTSNSTDAMLVANNATGAIFYASNGTIHVSNNGGGNQITGYRLEVDNNATVNYLVGLQNAEFTNGPGASWVTVPGSYSIVK